MNTLSAKQLLFTYIALALAVLFWGLSFVATKIALQSFPPFCLIFLRFLTAAIFFTFLLLRTGFPTITWKNLKPLLFLAVFQPGLYFTFETIGLQHTSATKASLIIATIPIVVLLLSILFLKERVRPLNVIGIIVSIFGVALLIFGGSNGYETGGTLLGDALILGAVLSASMYMILTRRLGEFFSPIQITGMQIIIGAIIFFPAFLFTLPRVKWQSITGDAVIAVVALTVFATIGAFLCYNFALKKIPASRVSVCINGIPLVTACGAWILLGEQLAPLQFLGGAIVIAAVYLANVNPESVTASDIEKSERLHK
jgi:drug/metabolite transporter (DMT)-like permease